MDFNRPILVEVCDLNVAFGDDFVYPIDNDGFDFNKRR
jgi:hypothetical protein